MRLVDKLGVFLWFNKMRSKIIEYLVATVPTYVCLLYLSQDIKSLAIYKVNVSNIPKLIDPINAIQ